MEQGTKEKMKKKHTFSFPLWAVFLLSLFLVILLYALLKDAYFEGPALLRDFIIDQTAIEGSNKTGEWELYWRLLWIGCFSVLGFFLIGRKLFGGEKEETYHFVDCERPYPLIGILCFVPALLQTLIYGKASGYLWGFAAVFCLLFLIFRDTAFSYCALFLILYFDLQIPFLLLSLKGITYALSDKLIFGLSVVALILFLAILHKFPGISRKVFFAAQIPLPVLLLLYCKNTYSYRGEVLHLKQPGVFLGFLAVLIVALFVLLFWQMKKNRESGELICVSSSISVFLYGSYIPAALIVQSDMHHHGEQMLPWQQIMDLGNTAYETYSPVSGLFPMLIGGIHDLLGGEATTYAFAFTILFLIFATLTIYMISHHVDGRWTLLFGFLFHMPAYCRTWILLPVFLLLMLPSVTRNRRRFLYLYVFSGFLSGLYYPLFGLALIAAGMPYALVQLFFYVKEKQWKRDVKEKSFYVETILIFLPIILAIPLLLSMASHILAYSHQTILADGLSLSRVSLPDWFLPYLTDFNSVRSALYYGLRFIGSMLPVWLFLLLLISFLHKNRGEEAAKSTVFFGLSGGFLLLPVCYTYTLVIMDESWVSRLFSRSSHIYLWILGIFLPILLLRFGREILNRQIHISLLTALCISIPFLCFYQMKDYQFPSLDGTTNGESGCVGEYSANFNPFPIGDEYVIVSETDLQTFPRLGKGFVKGDVLERVYDYSRRLDILRVADRELKILGLDKLQMYYFLLDESALYSGKVSLAKSREAAEAVYPHIDEHTIIGGDISPLNNYYIYRYLVKKGFVYDPISGFYISETLYTSLYGKKAYADSSLSDSPWAEPLYIGKCAYTLGANISNLKERLQPCDKEADFLYVEINTKVLEKELAAQIDENSIMTISWGGKSVLLTDYADGKLLIPLDMNGDWAVNSFSQVYISLYDSAAPAVKSDNIIPLEQVSDTFRYYTLKE